MLILLFECDREIKKIEVTKCEPLLRTHCESREAVTHELVCSECLPLQPTTTHHCLPQYLTLVAVPYLSPFFSVRSDPRRRSGGRTRIRSLCCAPPLWRVVGSRVLRARMVPGRLTMPKLSLKGQGESAAPAWLVVVGCDSRCMAGRHGAASLRAVARHHLVCEAEAEKSGAGPGHGSRR
jgi:hypothetical protein